MATINASVQLIDDEILSFYQSFPWGGAGRGRLVIVTNSSIVQTEIDLSKDWDIYDHNLNLDKPILLATRVPVRSVVRVHINSPLRYWSTDHPKRELVGVSVKVTASSGEIFEVITPEKFVSENPGQNIEEVLKVLKPYA